jgi:hypothetical protein
MAIVNGYTTLALLKNELGASTDTTDDNKLERAISAASRQIDKFVGRPHGFWQDATVTVREYFSDSQKMCYVDDISTLTGLIVAVDENDDATFATTLTITTNYIVGPVNAADETPARPFNYIRIVDYGDSSFFQWQSGRPNVRVTAKFGWPAVPDDVAQACLIQSAHLYKASSAAFGLVQMGMDGPMFRLSSRLNPIAEGLLDDYVAHQ